MSDPQPRSAATSGGDPLSSAGDACRGDGGWAVWQYTAYRLEAPLDAERARRFDVKGDVVLRVDEKGRSM